MVDNSELQKAVELIAQSSEILITTHIKPDGDACGCIAAVCDALASIGKRPKTILLSEVAEWYEFLFAQKPAVLGKDVTVEQLKQGQFADPDLIIIVDTNSYSQLPDFDQYLKQNDKPVLVLDHHVTADGLGCVELIDTAAAATGLIVFDLLRYAGWQVTEKIAQALFVAITTDTGWFRFPNTNSRVFSVCAELIDTGINPAQLYHDLYQNFSARRFKLMTAMLNTLELHLDERFATQHLLQADFKQADATYKDTENLIDECRRMNSVEAAALFVELADGRIRCSLRSAGCIDVRKIAQKFGGGGHIMAAGTHLAGPMGNAKKLIFEQIAEQFAKIDN